MEIWDIYNKYRQNTGRTHERGNPMNEGDYHLVVHVWIVNDRGEFLIQKRQPWKIGWPNMWAESVAGSAIQGDNSKETAIRETKEELGIDLDISKSELLFTVKSSSGFEDIWLVRQNIDIRHLKLQYEEVADAKWVTLEEIRNMMQTGEFISLDYYDDLFEMINSNIVLSLAKADDAQILLDIQKEVFLPLYEKYHDHGTSPVNQTLENFLKRFDIGHYYKILHQNYLVGSVFVYEKEPGVMNLHIINIIRRSQNKGIAQEVIRRLELMYPQAIRWELETILSEKRNCYLYEKMGYVQSGELKVINDKMSLVSYKKLMDTL
ncbi:NUDIX domain-containing protein [Clostridium sp. CS001]|uniref:NUDIX hydrolase n=1 Tax=Clostridium sp. CS001 TaxID=2880648 RepID=UPI001CF26648|nr:GNAT family N-acetyltransferase [Clostridium sp. CS001]MCB2289396.1 NUDIX domain-containing protein [Clostridium sp. CS001]